MNFSTLNDSRDKTNEQNAKTISFMPLKSFGPNFKVWNRAREGGVSYMYMFLSAETDILERFLF